MDWLQWAVGAQPGFVHWTFIWSSLKAWLLRLLAYNMHCTELEMSLYCISGHFSCDDYQFVNLLWPPYVIGGAIIFLPCGYYLSFYLFFPRLISAAGLPYFHTWCGLSANLGCMSEMCGTRLAANTGRKKRSQKSPSGHHRTTLSGYIFAIKARIDNRKKTC